MWLAFAHSSSVAPWVQEAFQFSSEISVEEDTLLLLEVGASARYFGGLDALLNKILRAIPIPNWALTPHPEASLWCARAGLNQKIPKDHLQSVLNCLPIEVMGLPPNTVEAILRCGLKTIGALEALPRSSLARRWGLGLARRLEAAYVHPRPLLTLPLPETFSVHRDLDDPVHLWEHARSCVEEVLFEALHWCALRGLMMRQLKLMFDHGRGAHTAFVMGSDSGDVLLTWMRLIELRLEREPLKDWTMGVSLELLALAPRVQTTASLLPQASKTLAQNKALLEILEARLGPEAIEGVYSYPDHRPECAYVREAPGQAHIPALPAALRPCWLLEPPRCLGVAPIFKGPLSLLSGPERIETGWWDGNAVRRDYFVAVHPTGSRYWIFRECDPPRHWFLQGVFA